MSRIEVSIVFIHLPRLVCAYEAKSLILFSHPTQWNYCNRTIAMKLLRIYCVVNQIRVGRQDIRVRLNWIHQHHHWHIPMDWTRQNRQNFVVCRSNGILIHRRHEAGQVVISVEVHRLDWIIVRLHRKMRVIKAPSSSEDATNIPSPNITNRPNKKNQWRYTPLFKHQRNKNLGAI